MTALYLPRSVHLVARMINLDAQFMISLLACISMHDWTKHGTLFNPLSGIHNFVQQVARYDLWFLCSMHLDARQNPSRNELKCGNFGKYFFNQRIINRQARYSFRATSCTLRFIISCVACISMHDWTKHGTLFNPLSGIRNFVQQAARYDLWFPA